MEFAYFSSSFVCLLRYAGQVGYASMGIKSPSEVITGDVFFDGTEAPTTVDYVEPVKHMVGFLSGRLFPNVLSLQIITHKTGCSF